MGNKLYGVDIAGILNRELGRGMLAATLTRVTKGTRTTGALTAGTNPTETPHAARGIIDDYAEGQINGTVVRVGDRKVLLLGDSIADGVVPRPNDKVTIEGRTYRIVRVKRDPAGATYECQARGRAG